MKKKSIIELTRHTEYEYRGMEKLPLRVMAQDVRSGQNIGSILRTSDAFLVKEVIMAGISAVPPASEISKTALGAERSVEWRYVADGVEEIKRLKDSGVKVLVLEQTHGSVDLKDFKALEGEEYVLVLGNEVEGVDQRIVDMADMALEIPMEGVKHSLNVSVSGGIALWKIYCELKNKQ